MNIKNVLLEVKSFFNEKLSPPEYTVNLRRVFNKTLSDPSYRCKDWICEPRFQYLKHQFFLNFKKNEPLNPITICLCSGNFVKNALFENAFDENPVLKYLRDQGLVIISKSISLPNGEEPYDNIESNSKHKLIINADHIKNAVKSNSDISHKCYCLADDTGLNIPELGELNPNDRLKRYDELVREKLHLIKEEDRPKIQTILNDELKEGIAKTIPLLKAVCHSVVGDGFTTEVEGYLECAISIMEVNKHKLKDKPFIKVRTQVQPVSIELDETPLVNFVKPKFHHEATMNSIMKYRGSSLAHVGKGTFAPYKSSTAFDINVTWAVLDCLLRHNKKKEPKEE